jgi:cysteine desulfurase
MSASRTYCDYNATAPLRPEAHAAMLAALELFGNPSSVHAEGRRARALVEAAREQVAGTIGACREDVAFTSGGTEAAQAPILGAMRADPSLELLASPIEHDCVAALSGGVSPRWSVRADGVVDLESLKDGVATIAGQGRRPLVSLMLVNNETGVIQPVAEAAAIVHAAGGLIHCDAAQAPGRMGVSILDLEVDYLSLSAHKLGGPQGAGAFHVRPGAPFLAVQAGGGQELGRRAGTENVAAIAGFGAACEAASRQLESYQSLAVHRDRMETALKAAIPTLRVHGEAAPRVAGVSCFGVDGWPAETQIMAMDLAGFSLSAGAACSSGKVRPSRVLTAMGLPEGLAKSSVRASFGWASRPEDFDALAMAWVKAAGRARPGLVNKEATHA